MKEQILKKIKEAFINEPYVGDENIVYNNSKDNLECFELKKQFLGKKWENVSKELMFNNKDSIPFFSSKGFHYYLPAFMHFIISDYHGSDTLADNVISKLTLPQEMDYIDMAQNIKMYELDKKNPELDFEGFLYEQIETINDNTKLFLEMTSLFNLRQKRVVLDFLKYMDKTHSEDYAYNPVKPIIAIERFWFQFE